LVLVYIKFVSLKKYLRQVLLGTCEIVKVVKIIVDSKCTGCETCVNTCPASVYEIKDCKSVPVRVEECILCRTCESQCPEGAIQVIEVEIEPAEVKPQKAEAPKRKIKKTSPKPAKSKKKSSH
jgi:NAD-dependent dihydropyrimidine dehydrogenase PreA subunit